MPEGTLEEFDSLQCRWASVKEIAEGNLKQLEDLRNAWTECLEGIKNHKEWIGKAREIQDGLPRKDIAAEAELMRVSSYNELLVCMNGTNSRCWWYTELLAERFRSFI